MKTAIRDGFGKGMSEVAAQDERVTVLIADLTESLRLTEFKEKFPNRFVEVGISEQNMVSMAAGMAHVGLLPFACSFAAFNPGRTFDQIRASVCYSNLNVKIVGGHAGVSVGEDGATHQMLEDIALTRVLPNMTVVVPADAEEARKAVHAIANHVGPTYLRLSREPIEPLIESPFTLGVANMLLHGTDVTIIACGLLVGESLQAAQQLRSRGISAAVINCHTIKPLDVHTILQSVRRTRAVVTAEEHQIAGGLGGAIAELLAQKLPVPMERVGVHDVFGQSGTGSELLTHYGLRASNVVHAVQRVLRRKHS